MSDIRPRFERIARRTVSDEIREALLRSIETGELPPGAKLPTERALCEDFNVARTSVREAIQGLATLGVIEKRAGRAYVTEQLPDVQFDQMERRKDRIRELFEMREIVEVPMARLAAQRATAGQRAEIQAIAARFDERMGLEKFRELDRAFHWSIASAAGNRALAEFYGKLLDSLFQSPEFDEMLHARSNRDAVRDVIRESTHDHRTIAEGIAEGDLDKVDKAAVGHLQQVAGGMISRML